MIHCGDEQGRTAYHEVAHAVVVQAVGYNVQSVLIRDDHSGEAFWSEPANSHPTFDEALQALKSFATISAAGYVAEQIKWQYARAPEKNLVGNVAARLNAVYELAQAVPVETKKSLLSFAVGQPLLDAAASLVEMMEQSAEVILGSNWAVVEELAATLNERRKIEGEELDLILSAVQSAVPCGSG